MVWCVQGPGKMLLGLAWDVRRGVAAHQLGQVAKDPILLRFKSQVKSLFPHRL